tara:strand:- start:906 stop:1907 length:1002 start_codon:yes stop_codon:yes gene_type:complete
LKTIKYPICNSNEFVKFRNLFDDRYGKPNIYVISKCLCCSHLITNPRIKSEDLPNLYKNFYPRKNLTCKSILEEAEKEQARFSEIFRWLKGASNQGQFYVKKNQSMLDIGCGSGLSLIEAANQAAYAYGIEADPNIRNIAKKLNLEIFIGELDEFTFKNKKFDLRVINQVIEHIQEQNNFLKVVKNKMSKKSSLIISFPNTKSFWRFISREKWMNWHVLYNLHHFNANNFIRMVNKCGFRIIKQNTITPNISTLMQIRTYLQKRKVGQKSKLWITDTKTKGNMKLNKNTKFLPFYSKIIIKFFIEFIIIIINRIIDMICKGDSLVFFLKPEES